MSKINGISTENRRKAILEELERNGQVTVSSLALLYGKSEVTIRHDLHNLEQLNLLHRVHGGAISQRSAYKSYYNASLSERMNINKEEKIKIAKACADLIHDGETIIIDSGTTTLYIAQELAKRSNLTILTNCLLIAQEFLYNLGNKVIMLGGDIEPTNQFTYGNDTITHLQKYRADTYILSIDGISVNNGVTTFHHQETEVSRQMIERVNKVITVADHTKIGKEGFSKICGLDHIQVLVTDAYSQNNKELERIRNQGIKIIEV